MANYCSNCHKECDELDLYCEECIDLMADTWMCPKCDYQNENEDTRCVECGEKQ